MSLRTIHRIALAVFRESVRDRVLYNLVGFALLVIGTSYLIGQISAGEDVKIIKDLGLAAMSIFGVFIAIFIGIGLVSKEVERRSIYSLIAKPVRRSELVVGKFAGLVLTIAINLAIMAAVWYAVLGVMAVVRAGVVQEGVGSAGHRSADADGGLSDLRAADGVVALATFFSTFAGPMLAAVFTFALYVAGHFSADLKHFDIVVGDSPVRYVTSALYYLLPNMATFDVKNAVVHAQPVPFGYLVTATLYGVSYSLALVAASVWIFSRRDFK